MTIDDIKALIAADESRTLELKKTTGELKDGMHAACAFLNTEGGWLIFGIAPKSLKIIGQQVTDDTKREIAQALAELEPAYDITPIYVDTRFASGSPQVRQLVELMEKGDYTIKELTELCGFIDPKHFREGYIKPTLSENAIERLYADRPNHPKQKYRLTEVAKEWKEFNLKS